MLPQIMTPTFEVKIPSTKKTIKFRPFLVKEEKLLLMAAASTDPKEIINTTLQVIKNCVIETQVDIDKLTFFEIDYLFILLRAKSIGEKVDMNFLCKNKVGEDQCNTVFPVELDLLNTIITKVNSSDKPWITPTVGVQLRYPSYIEMKSTEHLNALERKLVIIKASIESLFDKENVQFVKDLPDGELDTFIDNLTKSQFDVLEKWVDNFPTFQIEQKQACPKCGFVHEIKYKDFTSFF